MSVLADFKRCFGVSMGRPGSVGLRKVNCEQGDDVFGVVVLFRSPSLLLPQRCFVCGDKVTGGEGDRFVFPLPGDTLMPRFPVCVQHEGVSRGLMIFPEFLGAVIGLVYVFSRSKEFLLEVDGVNGISPVPPWVAFPDKPCDSSWKQGVEEFYLLNFWGPYWRGLSDGVRYNVVAKNPFPKTWKNWRQTFWGPVFQPFCEG